MVVQCLCREIGCILLLKGQTLPHSLPVLLDVTIQIGSGVFMEMMSPYIAVLVSS